ncbi:hypothetical protein WS91_10150 [Burkholderia sp. MSMB1498]|nr:hypothetical protein WS91_10150 [Burkholderia sp. MSMB1498]
MPAGGGAGALPAAYAAVRAAVDPRTILNDRLERPESHGPRTCVQASPITRRLRYAGRHSPGIE